MDEQRKLIFYPQWYNVIKVQPDSLRLAIYDAILQYKYEGNEPTEPMVLMAFGFIKQQIDADEQKYNDVCEARREAGKKGNEKRWHSQAVANIANVANAINESQNIANVANNNCNSNNNINNNIKKTSKEGKKEIAAACAATLAKVRKEFYNELIPYVEIYGKDMIREFYDYWTEPNKSQTKIRKQLEKTWDTNRRLRTWANREKRNSNENNRHDCTTANERATEVQQLIAGLLADNEPTDTLR